MLTYVELDYLAVSQHEVGLSEARLVVLTDVNTFNWRQEHWGQDWDFRLEPVFISVLNRDSDEFNSLGIGANNVLDATFDCDARSGILNLTVPL